MAMYQISVICPVYNAEKYIERAIKSVINQSLGFENIELILVDDCSTDSSYEIIKDYAEKHENILRFRTEYNQGYPGIARNIGIENASADYIMFIDNDDEFERDFCQTMYERMASEDLDLISSNYYIIKPTNISKQPFFDYLDDYDSKDKDMKYIDLKGFVNVISPEVWCKIYKKSIIRDNDIKFPETLICDDLYFLFKYFHYAKRIAFIDYYGYKWYRYEGNLNHYSLKYTYAFIESYYKIYALIEDLYGTVDWNIVFKIPIEWLIIRIAFSYENKRQLDDMTRELYDLEKSIGFDGALNYPRINSINKLLLKKHFSIVKILLIIFRMMKRLNIVEF